MGSVEVFARRQPALFVGAAVALGFALTRVVGAGDRDADARVAEGPLWPARPGRERSAPGARSDGDPAGEPLDR